MPLSEQDGRQDIVREEMGVISVIAPPIVTLRKPINIMSRDRLPYLTITMSHLPLDRITHYSNRAIFNQYSYKNKNIT